MEEEWRGEGEGEEDGLGGGGGDLGGHERRALVFLGDLAEFRTVGHEEAGF